MGMEISGFLTGKARVAAKKHIAFDAQREASGG
jgi:hypothetical protein